MSLSGRALARSAALYAGGIGQQISGAQERALRRCRVQILYFHYLGPGDAARLRRLLETLSAGHRFVSYSEAVRRIAADEIDRPYLAFSCDDGEESALEAAEVFYEFGISACFFLCPGVVDDPSLEALEAFRERTHRPGAAYLSWGGVGRLLAMGHEVGAHTTDHLRLSRLRPAEAEDQIVGSRKRLETNCGYVRHFAFPFGRFFHFSALMKEVVFEGGFESCASAERGAHPPGSLPPGGERLCLRRDHVAPGWPVSHSLYLIARSASRALPSDGAFPF